MYGHKSIHLPTFTSPCPLACFSSEEQTTASPLSTSPLLPFPSSPPEEMTAPFPGWPRGGLRGSPSPALAEEQGTGEAVPLGLEQGAQSPQPRCTEGTRLTWPVGACRSSPQLPAAPLGSLLGGSLSEGKQTPGELFALGKGCTAKLVWNNRWFQRNWEVYQHKPNTKT